MKADKIAYKMPYNWCCLFLDIKSTISLRNWQIFFLLLQYDFITTFPLEGNVIRKNDSACRRQRAKKCNGTLGTRLRKRTSVSKASFLLALWSILYMAWFEDLKMKRRTEEEEDIFLFFLQLYFCEKYPVVKILLLSQQLQEIPKMTKLILLLLSVTSFLIGKAKEHDVHLDRRGVEKSFWKFGFALREELYLHFIII